jgi:PAS domain S-box-containing protein
MKFDITLRTRLVMLVLAAIVPLFGLAVVGAVLTSGKAVSQATQNLEFSASLVAANQERVAESARQILTAIANMPIVQEGKDADCQQYLQVLNSQALGYSNLGIVGLDGYLRCHAMGGRPGEFAGDRSYFQEAIARQGFVASGYLNGRVTGKPVVVFAQPVVNKQGIISAVALAAVSLTELSKSLADAPLPNGTHFVITDRQGIVLATNLENPMAIGQKLPDPALLAAVKAGVAGGLEGGASTGAQQIYAFLPSGKSADSPFFVAVSVDKNEVLAPARQRLALVYLALTLVAALGSWIAWVLGGRAIVKPAAAILDATRQLQQGRLDVRIPSQLVDEGGELAQIAAGFNRVADSMQASQLAFEAELARSKSTQENLHDAQRLARIGYWQIDLATERLTLSDDVYEVFGIDRLHFDGSYKSFLKGLHPADREGYEQVRNAALRSGKPFEIVFRMINRVGDMRWVHMIGRVHFDSDGKTPVSRAGVVQDITERKNAELTIARSTELLNRTGALAKIGGWELAVETMTRYWSEETYRIHELDSSLGIDFEDAVGFYGMEAQPVMRAAVKAALQNATPWDMELPLITAKGRRIWVRTQGRALLEEGKVVRLVGVLQDITGQYEAQAHLRLLETCISRLNDVVMITEAEPIDESGPRIVFVNEAFERQTGYSCEEVLGQSPRFLQGPKTRRSELDRIGCALKNWQPVRSELINYTKSGREFWVELDIVPISNEKGCFTHWVAVQRDITQRKLAEQALIESEQRYGALFETAPVPMWVYDTATTRFLAVNHAAAQAYGYSAAEFLSMTIFDIRPEVEHERLRQWLGNPSRKKTLWHDLRKDGSLFSVETVSRPIQYADRAARFVVVLDKTAQDEAEKAVQDYLFTLQRAADAAHAITWHQTLEGTMQEIAEQARGVIGAHQAVVSLSGDSHHLQTIHALSLSEKYALYRGLMQAPDGNGIDAMVCENNRSVRLTQAELEAHPRWRGFGSDADKHPAMRGWLAVPLTGRNGKNIGLLQLSDKYEGEFTKQDEYVALELGHLASAAIENSRLLEEISQLNAGLEQKVAERTVALARQEALFRALAEQAPQTVWTASPDGAATYFNRAWFDLMGGELKDWTGYKWLAAVHPEDVADIKARWKISNANHSAYADIRRLLARDGSYHTMAHRASPVLDDQGKVIFWVAIDADITEIKATEAALRLSNQELEAFSYSVSHDLRSPLNTVDGFSRLLAKQLAPQLAGDAGEKVQHYLTRIQAGVAQMGQLIEDLLSLSHVTRAPLRTEPVDLSVMAHSLLDEWQARQPERQVAVHIESGLQAEADGRLVRVAMENLLTNAWKFTSQLAQAEISVGQKLDAVGLPVFFVRDNGAGFDMAYSDKLFEPFQRLHAASEFSGTGIGLATVSRVIKRHGGRIWAESAPGCGTTFFFTLPQVRRVV